ncbi:LysR family transcriptional regulator [Tropicibacter sp. R15_0]|uniref:LysR family transcriptional regulator n=1 Tax=Tropicibacter sp. R15_0 TaxID=2821101 RepID=UPI001AD960A7|nr:LysR family transcriptional regulator [Tropicibacter sp. R15_0]MBO9465442.1 LysR family transcriptional regulator [Tropicibacter sp. R15_0]
MDGKLTKTFMQVCNEGSIRAVAIAVGQEPSTISRRLTALETELGIQLLERRKKGVTPTEAGALLLNHLRGQEAEFEALTAEFDALRGLQRGTVSLAVGEGFISDLMKNALPGFKAAFPGITFAMRSGSTETVMQDIQNDTAHLGFVFNAQPNRDCKILASTIQPLELLASPGSEWADHKTPVSINALAAMPAALLMPGTGIGAMVHQVETIYGVHMTAALRANSLASIRNFVREGLGVSVLPSFVVAREIADGTIVTLPLDVPEFARGEVALIARNGRRLPEAAMRLANHVMRSMQAFRALD